MPIRIQLRRSKGWRKPDDAVVVSRPSKWGNPFKIGEPWPPGDPVELQHPATRAEVIDAYRDYLAGRLTIEPPPHDELVAELRGETLACWCPPHLDCHADVLLELANA